MLRRQSLRFARGWGGGEGRSLIVRIRWRWIRRGGRECEIGGCTTDSVAELPIQAVGA